MTMASTDLPVSPIATLRTVELTPEFETRLQHFYDANSAYFDAVQGEPAGPNEAHETLHDELPAGWPFTRLWLIGYLDADDSLVAVANVVSDLLAPGVWHIGLFIVATARHGSGEAQALYRGLEAWAAANGARWLRLGVVQGNLRAERFWQTLGYQQVRTRRDVVMGQRKNTLRVMVKALGNNTLELYLVRVERDRPEPAA
jgi:GNAT superfamily N-acetyltransferase